MSSASLSLNTWSSMLDAEGVELLLDLRLQLDHLLHLRGRDLVLQVAVVNDIQLALQQRLAYPPVLPEPFQAGEFPRVGAGFVQLDLQGGRALVILVLAADRGLETGQGGVTAQRYDPGFIRL